MNQEDIELFKSVVNDVVDGKITERNYFAEMLDNMITDAATKRNVSRAKIVAEVKEFVAELESKRQAYLDAHKIA